MTVPRSLAAASELLATKLVPSFISGELLRRHRLFAKLSANPDAKLILIQGSAGSGKSSLLYDYTKAQAVPVCWYSLQETDRDLKVFITYLVASIQMRYPDVGKSILPRIQQVPNLDQEWKEIFTRLLNEIHAHGKEILLVLDDYHALEDSPPIPDVMEFFLLNAPTNLRCFIASRNVPRLPLAYLRSKNALTLIRPQDLLLDGEEIRTLFHEIWREPLSDAALKTVHQKTEGWFAAARLVAQAVREKSPRQAEAYLQSLDLKEHFIYQYLAQEIYNHQPPDVRALLRCTSILTSFNDDLARFVSGLENTQEIIKTLQQMDLFVVHLDTRQEWFRYHHLFSEFLRNVLSEEESKARLKFLHHRAGVWHETHGNLPEAIEHYSQAKAFDEMAAILKAHGQALFQKGLITRLLAWILALSDAHTSGSQEILLLEGQIHDAMGNWEKAIARYEQALHVLRIQGQGESASSILEKLILCLIKYGEYSRIFAYCTEALQSCPAENKKLKSRLLSWVGVAHVIYGDEEWAKAYEFLKEAYLLAYESGDPEAIASACIGHGFMYHFPQGNFAEAERVLREGADLLKRLGFSFLSCHQTMNEAVVQTFGGSYEEAGVTIREISQLVDKHQLHFVRQALNVTKAMLYLEKKEFNVAKEILLQVTEQEIPLQIRPWYYRSVALQLVAEKKLQQAAVAAEEMLSQLRLVGKGIYAPECFLVFGLICWMRRALDKALHWFEEALSIARKGQMKFWKAKAHYALAGLLSQMTPGTRQFKEHYKAAIRLTRNNGYWHLWSTDPFDCAVPAVVEAFRLNLEEPDTKRIMERIEDRLLKEAEILLKTDPKRKHTLACKILESLGDEEALLMLKQHQKFVGQSTEPKQSVALARLHVHPPLSISALGQFAVRRGQKAVSPSNWERPKALKIFKYLLVHYPKEVVADQLLEIFWPDHAPREARHNLSVHLNHIRKALSPSGARGDDTFIQGGQEIIKFRLREHDYLDIVDFEQKVLQAYASWDRREIDHAIGLLKSALQVYRGELLEGNPYEDWAQGKREELQQKHASILLRLGAFYQEMPDYQQAITYYQRYLKHALTDEAALQEMLKCLAAIGDRASAEKLYSNFTLALKEHLAQEPSSTSQELIRQILPP